MLEPSWAKTTWQFFLGGVCSESRNVFHGFLAKAKDLAKWIASRWPGLLEIIADFQSEGTTLNFRLFMFFFQLFLSPRGEIGEFYFVSFVFCQRSRRSPAAISFHLQVCFFFLQRVMPSFAHHISVANGNSSEQRHFLRPRWNNGWFSFFNLAKSKQTFATAASQLRRNFRGSLPYWQRGWGSWVYAWVETPQWSKCKRIPFVCWSWRK